MKGCPHDAHSTRNDTDPRFWQTATEDACSKASRCLFSKKNQPEENDTQKRANKLSRTIGTFIIIIGLPVMLLGAGLFFLGENVGYRFGGFVVGIIGAGDCQLWHNICNSEKQWQNFLVMALLQPEEVSGHVHMVPWIYLVRHLGYIVATAFFLIVGGTGHFNHYSRTTSYIPKAVRPSTTSLWKDP